MKTEEELIWESYTNSDIIWLYHGGAKWEKFNAKISKPKRGRYEAGAGIYLTNNYETARKYARGNKVVSKVGISKNITLAEDVLIPKEDVVRFVKTYIGPKNRGAFLESIEEYTKHPDKYPAYYLVNLSVGYEVGGSQALAIKDFIVEYGVDASKYKQSGEEVWIVVHNVDIIKKVIHTKPSDISVDEYMLSI